MRDEMQLHIELEAERLAREEQLAPQEARRLARVRFGGVEKYKDAGRDARGGGWIDAMALDSRLGARMLAKYKGLTLIGGFAMAVAIAISATAFETLNETLTPALPFEDGDRIVSLQSATANPGTAAQPAGRLRRLARGAHLHRGAGRVSHGPAEPSVALRAARADQAG